ncbi:MAG: carboxymuconolactone decarboxylase family protein [Acidobacteriia bacterium]|nr:carboxymuconolactone decarboxylase family protein [Terriglobia bacterium]
MKNKLPQRTQTLRKSYPGVWKSFQDLGEQCHRAGPLEERARRLVKVGISAAAQSEGAVHSAVRHARIAGVPAQEIRHAILLSITTIGFPRAMAALSWAEDILKRRVD